MHIASGNRNRYLLLLLYIIIVLSVRISFTSENVRLLMLLLCFINWMLFYVAIFRKVTRKWDNCPVSWGCRIHWLLLCRGVRPPNESPGYDTKQSDGEVPAVPELWRMRSTPSLPSLPGPLWPGVVAPDWALSMG